jgi:hypothetical protein
MDLRNFEIKNGMKRSKPCSQIWIILHIDHKLSSHFVSQANLFYSFPSHNIYIYVCIYIHTYIYVYIYVCVCIYIGNISSGNWPLHANYGNFNLSHTILIQGRAHGRWKGWFAKFMGGGRRDLKRWFIDQNYAQVLHESNLYLKVMWQNL